MSLLQITEPGVDTAPHKRNIAIGIDLGTTNSLVATIKSGESVILENENSEALIPSIVYYGKDNYCVGTQALGYRVKDPANTIISVKRFMGRTFKDLDALVTYPYKFINSENIIQIDTARGVKNPIEISSDILQSLKNIATKRMGEEPAGAVITVPAYFNETQRQATKQAAELAGLKVLRLLNEPTAAAIAYGLDNKSEGTFLIFDLGGGTLDVSILRLNKGVFEVLAVNGDTKLGGDDFDHRLYCYILEKSQLNQLSDEDIALLLNTAKKLKEDLSTKDKVCFNLVLSNKRLINLSISREEFNHITETLVKKAMLPVAKALRDSGLQKYEIDDIVLVGGSTRMPNVQKALSDMFSCEVLTTIDPYKVVALGAAIQADILIGNRKEDWLLLDVTPLSLGIETMGGIIEKIIPRNSTIPLARAQEFTTYKDGQTSISIHVVQGERELVKDCRSLAKFSLKGIPPMVAGQARIRVNFQIDADGLLIVSAVETTTNQSSSIEIKPSFGLDETQIMAMLKDSIANAKIDMDNRQLQEAVINANSMLDTIGNAIKKDGDLLNKDELSMINLLTSELNELISANLELKDKQVKLESMVKKLNELTQDFAAKRMERALKLGLSGKSITDI